MERWRPVREFPNYYRVSSEGRVRRIAGGKGAKRFSILRPQRKGAYWGVHLAVERKHYQRYIHRLVAEAFIGVIPDGYHVHHINGNHANNCLDNLEIVTRQQNIIYAIEAGTIGKVGEDNPMAKLTEDEVRLIRVSPLAPRVVAEEYGVSQATIRLIRRGLRWSHLA
jgi:hypothetical protein